MQRSKVPHPDGQQRWDSAYQILLTEIQPSLSPVLIYVISPPEVIDESGILRAGIHSATSPGANH